ncbi:hypothetical protein T439DRAFT_336518 [Meredithblackwellia eburnea MCA 4105]
MSYPPNEKIIIHQHAHAYGHRTDSGEPRVEIAKGLLNANDVAVKGIVTVENPTSDMFISIDYLKPHYYKIDLTDPVLIMFTDKPLGIPGQRPYRDKGWDKSWAESDRGKMDIIGYSGKPFSGCHIWWGIAWETDHEHSEWFGNRVVMLHHSGIHQIENIENLVPFIRGNWTPLSDVSDLIVNPRMVQGGDTHPTRQIRNSESPERSVAHSRVRRPRIFKSDFF